MDILTGCTGSVAAEVVKCTAKPVIRHVGYLFRFKKIVDDLTKAKTDLQLEQQKVQGAIERAAMNNEIAEKDVERWLTNVNQLMGEVQAFEIEVQVNLRFCNGWCPDWIRRYRLCKEAIQKTDAVKKLQDERGKFSELTHRAPTPGIEIFSSSDFEVFESRKLAVQQIMEALHEDDNKGIGLYGMGGIGKTTLVKEVYKKVKKLNIFNDIVMIVVSRTPDVRRIQGEIADCLNLKLDDESDMARACQICLRIKSVEKILLIVDDVWDSVELKDFGIPSPDDHKGCRILLTTRSKHVCHLMLCHQKMISLNFLSEKESLALMKSTVGDNPDLNDVMLKVVEECEGLPIAISTVGKALKGKTLNEWNVAIYELGRSRLVDIEGVNEEKNAYVFIKWSYDQLKCKTKLCFLLCSLFPEDYNIPIEELTRYVMGLEEDEDFDSLDEARSQVRAAINNLKDSSLLLDGFGREYVNMHDMVRDVGLWIASEGKNEFELRACTRLDKNRNFEQVTAISLMASNTKQLPDKLVCPRLNILLLGGIRSSNEISNALFEGMNYLKVLKLHDIILSSQSLELLTNLRTLYLKNCNFSDDLSSLGKLKRLEALSFYDCGINALPSELGEMVSLKMLDLTLCYQLRQIPPNVIRRLSQLEELIINGSFQNWDVEGTTSEISNANLSELNSLPRLVILSLELNSKHLPKGFVFPDLHRYFISINCGGWTTVKPFIYGSLTCINSRTLEIKDLNASSMNALKSLFHTVEYISIESGEMECIVDTVTSGNLVELYLKEMSCLRTICEGPNQYEIFSNLTVLHAHGCPRLISLFSPSLAQSLKKLKELYIFECDEMKQIISEEEMILESHHQPICLPELKTLEVKKCKKLEYIFPMTVARGFPHLETLRMSKLPQLKQVIGHEDEGEVVDGNDVILSKLRWLILEDLPNFGTLYRGTCSSMWPSLEVLKVVNCPGMKSSFAADLEANMQALGKKLKVLHVEGRLCDIALLLLTQGLLNLEDLGINNCEELEEMFKPAGFLSQGNYQDELLLSRLTVSRCKRLRKLFTLTIAQSLQKLRFLNIDRCDELEHLITQDDQILPEAHLQHTFFPQLVEVSVNECNKMTCLFPVTIADGLLRLRRVEIKGASQFVEVFAQKEEREGQIRKDVLLPKLKYLTFTRLPRLVNLCPRNFHFTLPSLYRLDLDVLTCPDITDRFTSALEDVVHVNGESSR